MFMSVIVSRLSSKQRWRASFPLQMLSCTALSLHCKETSQQTRRPESNEEEASGASAGSSASDSPFVVACSSPCGDDLKRRSCRVPEATQVCRLKGGSIAYHAAAASSHRGRETLWTSRDGLCMLQRCSSVTMAKVWPDRDDSSP